MLSGNDSARVRRLPERSRAGATPTVLEIIACLLLFGAGLPTLGRYLVWMGSTSLWTDELRTILDYSGRGPLATLTTYHEPNNHIFFNLVSSVTPGRHSVVPLRARAWSFVAVLLTLGISVGFFVRRRAPAFGALLFCLLAAQPELLDLLLQARGYSFLSLFALAAALLTIALFRGVRARTLIGLAFVSVAGAWTVPTFALFVAPLWALNVLVLRRRSVFVAAAATAAGTLAVYAPVAGQLLYQMRRYGAEWGRQYGRLEAVSETVQTYFLSPALLGHISGNRGVAAGFLVTGLLLAFALRRSFKEALPVAVVLGAVASFFLACLALQTPLVRATAFIVVPLGLCTVYLLFLLLGTGPPVLRRVPILLLGVFFAFQARRSAAELRFLPFEQWEEMAATLRDSFPEGTKVRIVDNIDFLSAYLWPGYVPVYGIDAARFAHGEELYVDGPVEDPPGGRIDERVVAADAVEFRIPQRRAGYEALWFCPPRRSFLSAVRTPDGRFVTQVTDHRMDTGTGEIAAGENAVPWVEIELERGKRYRSLVVVFAPGSEELPSVLAFGRRSEPVQVGPLRRSRNVTLVCLRDEAVALVTVCGPSGSTSLPSIQEAWAYPAARD